MRIDHIALRVPNKNKAMEFFISALNYKFQDEFEIYFNDEKTDNTSCVALEPPEKLTKELPWTIGYGDSIYSMPPEIFISEGGSIVSNWVKSRGNFGGVHHIAYQINTEQTVQEVMEEWIKKGFSEFTTDVPIKCPGLEQIFTKCNVTGLIFELIKREGQGFCKENIRELISKSVEIDSNIP